MNTMDLAIVIYMNIGRVLESCSLNLAANMVAFLFRFYALLIINYYLQDAE